MGIQVIFPQKQLYSKFSLINCLVATPLYTHKAFPFALESKDEHKIYWKKKKKKKKKAKELTASKDSLCEVTGTLCNACCFSSILINGLGSAEPTSIPEIFQWLLLMWGLCSFFLYFSFSLLLFQFLHITSLFGGKLLSWFRLNKLSTYPILV